MAGCVLGWFSFAGGKSTEIQLGVMLGVMLIMLIVGIEVLGICFVSCRDV